MRQGRDLRRVQDSALGRISRLRAVADLAAASRSLKPSSLHQRDELVAFTVLELYNLWFGFSRALFLSTAFRARDGSGHRVVLSRVRSAASVDEALGHAIRRVKPRTFRQRQAPWNWVDEPSWGVARVLLDSLDELGASNYVTVSAGLSASPTVFVHLAKFRHFYAHRGRETAVSLRGPIGSYAIPARTHPSEALMTAVTRGGITRPQPLLLDWCDAVRDAVELVI